MLTSALLTGNGSKQRSVRWIDDSKSAQEGKDGRRGSLSVASINASSIANNNNNNNNSNDSGKKRGSGPSSEHVQQLWDKYVQTTVMSPFCHRESKKGTNLQSDSSLSTIPAPLGSEAKATLTAATAAATAAPAATPTTATPSTSGAASTVAGGSGNIWGVGVAEMYKDHDSQYAMKLSLPCPSHCSCCFCVYAKHLGPVRVYFSRFRKAKAKLPITKKQGSLAAKNNKNVLEDDESDQLEPEKVILKARWLTSSAPSGEVVVPEPPASLLEKFLEQVQHWRAVANNQYAPPLCPGCGQNLLTKEHSEGCRHRHSQCFGDSVVPHGQGRLQPGTRRASCSRNKSKARNATEGLSASFELLPAPFFPTLKAASVMSRESSQDVQSSLIGSPAGSPDFRSSFPDFRSKTLSSASLDLSPAVRVLGSALDGRSSSSLAPAIPSPHWLVNLSKDPTGFLRVPLKSPIGSRGPARVDLGTGRNLGKRKFKRSSRLPSLGDASGTDVKGPASFPERTSPVQIRLPSKRASN